jgi:hypothetical protein
MKHSQIGIGAIALLSLIGTGVALAASDSHEPARTHVEETPSAETSPREDSGSGKGRITENKLKSCQAHEAAIIKRSTQMTARATSMESNFADIATKVDSYYTTKLVPSGKTLSNYTALKSTIDTKKLAVDSALTASKADITSFSCTGDNPEASLTSFRTDMTTVNKALKDYRSAIKDFTKALHQSVGDSTSSATSSPKAKE